jgi:hypothetical protein
VRQSLLQLASGGRPVSGAGLELGDGLELGAGLEPRARMTLVW